jgi:hypothetical protein
MLQTFIIEWVRFLFIGVACGVTWLQERILKKHVSKRDKTTCSKYDNHSIYDNQEKLEETYINIQ